METDATATIRPAGSPISAQPPRPHATEVQHEVSRPPLIPTTGSTADHARRAAARAREGSRRVETGTKAANETNEALCTALRAQPPRG